MSDSNVKVPDLIGYVAGIRAFGDIQELHTPREMVLVSGHGVWRGGDNVAMCAAGHPHVPAVKDCACGFYAYHGLQYFDTNGQYGPIWATVRGWGKIQVAKDGWRAEHAEVLAIAPGPTVPYSSLKLDHLRRLTEEWEIPILQHHELEDYANQFAEFVPKEYRPGIVKRRRDRALIGQKSTSRKLAPASTVALAEAQGQTVTGGSYTRQPTNSAQKEVGLFLGATWSALTAFLLLATEMFALSAVLALVSAYLFYKIRKG